MKNLEQRLVLGVKVLPIILGQKKWKWQIKYSEKNLTVLCVDFFKTKNKLTTNVIKIRSWLIAWSVGEIKKILTQKGLE